MRQTLATGEEKNYEKAKRQTAVTIFHDCVTLEAIPEKDCGEEGSEWKMEDLAELG